MVVFVVEEMNSIMKLQRTILLSVNSSSVLIAPAPLKYVLEAAQTYGKIEHCQDVEEWENLGPIEGVWNFLLIVVIL